MGSMQTLIDLAAEEVGEDALVRLATGLADQTFASRQATQESSRALLRSVFALRARRVARVRSAGRLPWIRDTGARLRLIDSVESELMPSRAAWDDLVSPIVPGLVRVMLDWAWKQGDLREAIEGIRWPDRFAQLESRRRPLLDLVNAWLAGRRYGVDGNGNRSAGG